MPTTTLCYYGYGSLNHKCGPLYGALKIRLRLMRPLPRAMKGDGAAKGAPKRFPTDHSQGGSPTILGGSGAANTGLPYRFACQWGGLAVWGQSRRACPRPRRKAFLRGGVRKPRAEINTLGNINFAGGTRWERGNPSGFFGGDIKPNLSSSSCA